MGSRMSSFIRADGIFYERGPLFPCGGGVYPCTPHARSLGFVPWRLFWNRLCLRRAMWTNARVTCAGRLTNGEVRNRDGRRFWGRGLLTLWDGKNLVAAVETVGPWWQQECRAGMLARDWLLRGVSPTTDGQRGWSGSS